MKVLLGPLQQALRHVFSRAVSGCALVGGTALAGFYVGHRRSDNMDLFAESVEDLEDVIRAIKSLPAIGTVLENERRAPAYYRAVCRLEGTQVRE